MATPLLLLLMLLLLLPLLLLRIRDPILLASVTPILKRLWRTRRVLTFSFRACS